VLFATVAIPAIAMGNTIVRMQTSLGAIDIELFSDDPSVIDTVNNFLNYVNRSDYDNSLIHRSVPGFVIQGGGFTCVDACRDPLNPVINTIPADPSIPDQVGISNTRGTIAMAKTGPDTATSQWFVNLADNTGLDDTSRPDGGFTVFGQIPGNGMDIIDAIAALPVIDGRVDFGNPAFRELPIVPAPSFNFPVVATSVGPDSDGDGITDRQEDNSPNSGDANFDTFQDSGQVNVASFPMPSGDYAVLETMPGQAFQSTDVMEPSFGFTTFDLSNPPGIFDGFNFPYGYVGFDLVLASPGDTATVTMTLPADQNVSAYFKYGPTLADPVPHWYRFNFDGETGAEINGNVITLHFKDGGRGDSDLDSTNGIITDPGTPASRIGTPGSGDGGGGCSVVNNATRSEQAGAWWLLLLTIATFGVSRRYR
jgi:cyclophilin family peptidyl-prolyl cis-trans isomerase